VLLEWFVSVLPGWLGHYSIILPRGVGETTTLMVKEHTPGLMEGSLGTVVALPQGSKTRIVHLLEVRKNLGVDGPR
jgi:hypothetical protein